MKLTEEQRLSRAHLKIVNQIKHCAIGGVVVFGKTSIDERFPTAYTDGFTTKYGRKFVANMDEPELRFVVLHENYHKAFRHLTTWKHLYKEDPKLANIACDHVINLKLLDCGEILSETELKYLLIDGLSTKLRNRGIDFDITSPANSTVKRVSNHWMSSELAVHTNLMRTPCV
jgi:hypothetical protein